MRCSLNGKKYIEWITTASTDTAGFSAEPAFCRLAFDFAGFNENLVAFCRLESFAGFTFLPAGGHFASLKLTQRDETLSFPS